MRCVLLDTNIWVSAFLGPEGHCGRLVHRLLGAAAADVVICTALLDEVVDVLGRPRLVRRYGFTTEEVSAAGGPAKRLARSPWGPTSDPRNDLGSRARLYRANPAQSPGWRAANSAGGNGYEM